MIAIRRGLSRRWRRAGTIAGVLLTALLGSLLGLLLLGTVHAAVGPLETTMTIRPALWGDTRVDIAPLGYLTLDTHDGPFAVEVAIDELDEGRARAIVADPSTLVALEQELPGDIRRALIRLALQASAGVLLAAALAGALVYRRPARILMTTATAVGLVVIGAGVSVATWQPKAIAEPRYSGLLASAPSVVGDAQSIVGNFDKYRAQLAKVVTNVSRLYTAATTLPVYNTSDTVRVLHVSDIHLNLSAFDVISSLIQQFQIDVVVDTGDLTDHGTSAEGFIADEIGRLGVPYVFVRGNHDSLDLQRAVARQPNAVVLDNKIRVVHGIRFAGIGDPRFTPDKTTRYAEGSVSVTDSGRRLATTITDDPGGAEVALIHDPTGAEELKGTVPLVLAGHVHRRYDVNLGDGTLLLVEGSTGGAGLRGLETEKPTPLEATILYLSPKTGALQARDDVTLGGIGRTSVQIARHLATEESPIEAPPGPSPLPSPSPSVLPSLEPAPSIGPLPPLPSIVAAGPRDRRRPDRRTWCRTPPSATLPEVPNGHADPRPPGALIV